MPFDAIAIVLCGWPLKGKRLDAGPQAYRSLTNDVVKSICRCDYING
jgi:hypothetical protein